MSPEERITRIAEFDREFLRTHPNPSHQDRLAALKAAGLAPDWFGSATGTFGFQGERYTSSPPPRTIRAVPYAWRDPTTIPRRQWLYGTHRIRRYVCATVAPGALGKSTMVIAEALAMATGRSLLGVEPAPCGGVWYWNGEDPLEEIERRIAAACIHYDIGPGDLDRLFVGSGRDTEITIATSERTGTKIAQPNVDAIIETIKTNDIHAVIFDPFVSSHRVSENDNTAIQVVVSTWAKIAEIADCSIELVHHVRKGQSGQRAGQGEYTVEDGRGASALLAAARSARVLNRMSEDEAKQLAIANRFAFFRVDDGKPNMAPPAEASQWFQIVSTSLGNGDPDNLLDDGDRIGVATAWQWPNMMDGVTVSDLRAVQAAINAGRWRENFQANNWVGQVIATTLRLNVKTDRKRILSMLKTWIKTGMLVVVEGLDEKGNKRSFIEVGEAAND